MYLDAALPLSYSCAAIIQRCRCLCSEFRGHRCMIAAPLYDSGTAVSRYIGGGKIPDIIDESEK